MISEYTRKLTEGYFDLKALGAADIKGVEAPLNVYEVLGAGPLRTRFQVTARRGLTRFMGRQSELEQMQRAVEQAKAGHGQIVGIMVEPGLGKSRLFYEFKLISQSGCLVWEAFSLSHGKASPYLPLIELLKPYFQLESTDDNRTRRAKVIGHVLALDKNLEETFPYLLTLLGIDAPDSSLQHMDAQVRRQRTFEALKKLFVCESLNQPLIFIFEDLHWIDSETQGFLDALSESVASARLLLLVNYRPEYRHEWGGKTYYTQLRLTPLGQAEADELLTFLLGNDTSLVGLKALILERTDGTPFFMEEVVQTLAEEGALIGERGTYRLETTPAELHISPTVQGVLAARIDRLTGEEKTLLQQLAVIGRQFPLRLVKQVVTQPETELYRTLSSLQAKEFVYEQPAFPESAYLFKHALTQDVAYGTVLQEQRKVLHERTGHALEALYTENLEDHYSELAHHYSRSENTEKAVEYLGCAGQQAFQRSAYVEALQHLTLAIEMLRTLPNTSERSHNELPLQITIGAALQATKGFANPEVERAYMRARLCELVGELAQLAPALYGLWQLYILRAENHKAHKLGEQLFALAQTAPELALHPVAHRALGEPLLWLGEFSRAREHLERGNTLYNPEQHRGQAFLYAIDSGVAIRSTAAEVLWFLGYPEQALKRSHQAVTLAQELAHPFSLAHALNLASRIHQHCRDGHAVQDRAEAVMALSTEQGFPFFLAVGTFLRRWALAERGQAEAGIAEMRDCLTAWRTTGAELGVPWFTALLGERCGQAGQAEEGLALLAEAVEIVHRTEDSFYEAECYRLKGELLLQQLPVQQSEAEVCFQAALEVAGRQEAKSLELRAATSLARLWQQQGKTEEARDLLAPVYEWFIEGFDTADLKDAKALLEEFNHSH